MNSDDKNRLVKEFRQAKQKLILLDYDGTLVDYASTPDKARPSEKILKPLLLLASLPQTNVVIITGRAGDDIDHFFGSMPLEIIAEHGAMIKMRSGWHQLMDNTDEWKESLLQLFKEFVAGCPGSFVEVKKFSLAWHYRNAEEQPGLKSSRALLNKLNKIKDSYGLAVVEGNKVIEIRRSGVNKGKAVEFLIGRQSYDFILAVGDDRTDEDMFKTLIKNKSSYTIKVGSGETFAKYNIESVQKVIALLESLT